MWPRSKHVSLNSLTLKHGFRNLTFCSITCRSEVIDSAFSRWPPLMSRWLPVMWPRSKHVSLNSLTLKHGFRNLSLFALSLVIQKWEILHFQDGHHSCQDGRQSCDQGRNMVHWIPWPENMGLEVDPASLSLFVQKWDSGFSRCPPVMWPMFDFRNIFYWNPWPSKHWYRFWFHVPISIRCDEIAIFALFRYGDRSCGPV